MTFRAKKIDIQTKDVLIALINTADAIKYGINAGDQIYLNWAGAKMGIALIVDVTTTLVQVGRIGLFEDFWKDLDLEDGTPVELEVIFDGELKRIISKKIVGGKLTNSEIDFVVKEIAEGKANPVMTAFYVGAGYSPGFDFDEILSMTDSMAKNGEIMKYEGLTLDKHSVGGVGGKGLTPILIPIIACLDNVIVPNTSSKAVTAASATADMLECIMQMSFDIETLYKFIKQENCFMVWGGGLQLAPADDKIIRIQKQLGIESYDKLVSSIMAKKIAQGVKNVLFDLPYGKYAKLKNIEEAEKVEEIFYKIAKHFEINIIIHKRPVRGIDGNAVGPNLECREFLRVFEAHADASESLLDDALLMAGELYEMSGQASLGTGKLKARDAFLSGRAEEKLRRIISMQKGDHNILSTDMKVGVVQKDIRSTKDGVLEFINTKRVFDVCRALGNPFVKEAGIYFHKKPGDEVEVGESLATMYAMTDARMGYATTVIAQGGIWDIG